MDANSGRLSRPPFERAGQTEPVTVASSPAHGALRFAVLCRDLRWHPWQRRTVDQLVDLKRGQLVQIVRLAAPDDAPDAAPTDSDQMPPAVMEIAVADATTAALPGCVELSAAACAALAELDLDFILLFGIERVCGPVLDAARLGVWAFAGLGAVDGTYCGAAFWPVFNNQGTTTAALVRLAPQAGGDSVLKSGTLRTKRTYTANLRELGATMSQWPAVVANTASLGHPRPVSTLAAADWAAAVAQPTAVQKLVFGWQFVARLARTVLRFAFCFDVWNIGMARCDMRHILQHGLPEVIDWAPAPKFAHFCADPMVFEPASGGIKVLYEWFSYWTSKGDVRARTYSPSMGWSPDAEMMISEAFHLSYPAIWDMGGGKVCIPECTESGATFAYPLDEEGRPTGQRRPFAGFAVADPTLIEHEGRWYLFGAIAAEAQHTLRIWYADTLAGPWTPHPANPVKCDVHTARPAGPFVRIDGRLYRPSQSSAKSYGSSANLMEVLELSPTAFREEIARPLAPHPHWPYPHGVHTLTPTRDGVLIDGKIVRISPLAPFVRSINVIQARRRNRATAQANARFKSASKDVSYDQTQ